LEKNEKIDKQMNDVAFIVEEMDRSFMNLQLKLIESV